MSALKQIAYFQNRRDEVPNQELARKLAETKDRDGIREIAENLWNENKNIQSDCLKVLYEIGYLDPDLIASYASDFLKLLESRDNRMVWGAMIALSTIAEPAADALYPHIDFIQQTMDRGSVITVDAGVRALAAIAASSPDRRDEIFPYLRKHLQTCRPKDVPQHAEKILDAINAVNKGEFIDVLEKRMGDLTVAQAKRVRKVIRAAENVKEDGMSKPTTKGELLEEIRAERDQLERFLAPMSPEQMTRPGAIAGWSVKDVLAHLAEWERLLLDWYDAGRRGENPPLPAEGYGWEQMDDLNQEIYEKYRDWSLDEVLAYFRKSYQETLAAVQAMAEDELFTPRRYAWTKNNTLADYVIPCTSEHYQWARQEMREGLKTRR